MLYVIFPEDLPDTRILCFTKGTYLVSDTVAVAGYDPQTTLLDSSL